MIAILRWWPALVCAVAPARGSAAEPPLRIGMELAYPPFEMTDAQGRPAGISAELARALGRFLGREVEIRNTAFDGLIPALQTKKIDLILSSMTATPERARAIAFSEPYLTTGLCLLVRAGGPVTRAAGLDQPGRTVAVKKGTTGHVYAAQQLRHAKVLVLDKESAAVLEVSQGKADAFICDQMSVWSHWQKDPQHLRALLDPIQQESWAVGLRRGDDGLRAKVNAFLREFRAGGGFDRLGDRFLKQQKAAFDAQGIPFVF